VTVIERPLFGNVEIERLTPAWEEVARNLVRNPEGQPLLPPIGLASTWTRTGVAGTVSASNGFVRLTNTSAGSTALHARLVTYEPGETYTVVALVTVSRNVNVSISLRPTSANTADSTILATIPFQAGVSQIVRVTGLAPSVAPGTTPSLSFTASGSTPVNGWIEVYKPALVKGTYDGPTFSGANTGDDHTRYRWEGTPNSSISIMERTRVEFIQNATNVSIHRGGARNGVGVKTDVGIATFTLHNDEDPLQGGTLDIGQTIRVITKGSVFHPRDPVFTGRIADIASTYPLNKSTGEERTAVQVTVTDAVSIHVGTMRYGVQIAEGFETFESRIARLASSALAPIEPPVEGAPREVYAF
jgi:hypothetical protein